ncbi:TPA: hypothetical protein N0F65_000171 [Lagenidium giganteum]|uniref:Tc1-like transposase DDE domain-containing protein n=1 Tax=Lagenidium giganteum TaxID=4803 RepID=A0AAV2YNQ3_9STRA|nr:TPA: hypothetical protein N0F65_000171 [Lagenidium giganteum]
MIDHDDFVAWMAKLLTGMHARNLRNCRIVLDNAKYHKEPPASVPKKQNIEAGLIEACERYKFSYSQQDTKDILWEKLASYVAKNIGPVIMDMAAADGYQAIVKGEVGRQYTCQKTFADLRTRLENAFQHLSPTGVQGCIEKAQRSLLGLRGHIVTVDGQSGDSETSSSSDSEGESAGG